MKRMRDVWRSMSVSTFVSTLTALSLSFSPLINASGGNSDRVAHSYATTYGITAGEAASRLSRLSEISNLGNRLRRELPDAFAGLYVKHRPSFHVVVQFTNRAQERLMRYTDDPLFQARNAPYSMELLESVQAEVSEQLSSRGIAFESGIDVQLSRVNINVIDVESAELQIGRLISIFSFIKLHKVTGLMRVTSDFYGGTTAVGSQSYCTFGFNVIDANGVRGVSTAGHCDNVITDAFGSSMPFKSENNSGSYDIQWHKGPNSFVEFPNKIKIIDWTPTIIEITNSIGSSGLVVGWTVCKYGKNTGYDCGEIADMHAQTTYNGVVGEYIRVHNSNSEQMAVAGDSGGPVFGAGNTAYGIIHGRGASGTPYVDDMYFMPVDRFSVLGISVATTPP